MTTTTTTTTGLQDRERALMDSLGSSGILLVEWETTLYIRLGYPLVFNGSNCFLVPDANLSQVRSLAADAGLFPEDESTLRFSYNCEWCPLALRFRLNNIGEPGPDRRLVFAPFSWAGIRPSDVIPIAPDTAKVHTGNIAIQHWVINHPPYVHTVPLSVAIAAMVRIVVRTSHKSKLRILTMESLVSVITYALIDMSYEGDWMEFPGNEVPLSEEEKKEIEDAVAVIEGWEMRKGEEWIQSELIAIMRGEKDYDDLPSLERPRAE